MNKYKRGKIYEIVFPEEDGRVICKYQGTVKDGEPGHHHYNIEESYYHSFEAITNYHHTAIFWFSNHYIASGKVKIRELKLWEIVLNTLDESNASIGEFSSMAIYEDVYENMEARFTYD